MPRLRGILCGLLGLHLVACTEDPRPNILIAISDDQSSIHTRIAGDPVVATPAFDRVATEGVFFTHAFTPSPSCSPCRAGILTGKQIWQLGAAANLGGALDSTHVVLPDLLEEAGYHVGFTGKGWGPGEVQECRRSRNPAGNEFNVGGMENYIENFRAFLRTRPENQPFYFWFGSLDAHAPRERGAGVRLGMNPKNVRLPPHIPDDPRVRGQMLDYYAEVQRFDRDLQEMLDILKANGELDNTMVIVTSDNGIDFPRGKMNLYDYGSRVPLAIRFARKIRGGQTANELVSLIDLAPTILGAAGVAIPPEMAGRNLFPVMESGNEGIDSGFEEVIYGRERHAPYREKMRSYPSRALRTPDFLYIRNFTPDRWPSGDPPHYADSGSNELFIKLIISTGSRAPLSPYYELNYGKRGLEELYDLRSDPDQILNVANLEQYAAVKAAMWERLRTYLEETQDPRVRGEDGGWDTMPWNGRVVYPLTGAQRRSK